MSAVVEENSHSVIRQLVAKAVLVGVVHPFSHPLKIAAVWALRNVIRCRVRAQRWRIRMHLQGRFKDSTTLTVQSCTRLWKHPRAKLWNLTINHTEVLDVNKELGGNLGVIRKSGSVSLIYINSLVRVLGSPLCLDVSRSNTALAASWGLSMRNYLMANSMCRSWRCKSFHQVNSPLGILSRHPLNTLATVSATVPVVLSSRPLGTTTAGGH